MPTSLRAQDTERADVDYFRAIVGAVCASARAHSMPSSPPGWIANRCGSIPIEHAVLLIGAYELKEQPEVPFRVVINEGVSLAKRFGATDGHKFVNAVLDRAARSLRPNEH